MLFEKQMTQHIIASKRMNKLIISSKRMNEAIQIYYCFKENK